MAKSTGPILAAGAITLFNDVIVHGKPFDQNEWRIPVGTAIAAGGLVLIEKVSQPLATGIAWIALVSVLLTRMKADVPSPAESFVSWYNGGK